MCGAALLVFGLLTASAGCAPGVPGGGDMGFTAPGTPPHVENGVPGGSLADPVRISDLQLDTSAAGSLVNVATSQVLPPGPRGVFGLFSDGGYLMRQGDAAIEPDIYIQEISTGQVVEFGNSLYLGLASEKDGSGFVGEYLVLDDGSLIWMARQETGELALDSYDVFVKPSFGDPMRIGGSTPDLEGGLALSAPGDGNYLVTFGGRALWVEGELSSDMSESTRYSSIFSAPLDGSEPQRVEFIEARLPRVDSCSGSQRLIYVTDATSRGRFDEPGLVSEVTLSGPDLFEDQGTIWRAPERSVIDSVDVCGEVLAAAFTTWSEGDDPQAVESFIAISSAKGEAYFSMPEDSIGAGRVTATDFGVFFFDWGGTGYGKQYFYSLDLGRVFYIGDGASFGFSRVGGDCVAMAWSHTSTGDDAPQSYSVRQVCAS